MARKPGRPALDPKDASVQICVSVPGRQYDQLYRDAREERTSVPELVRRMMLAAELLVEDRKKKT